MSSINFWRDWTSPYKTLWFSFSILFVFSILFLWFSYFKGPEGVINWEKMAEQKTIETTVHQFKLGPFELSVPAESFVIFEYLQGSDLHHNTTASYIFLTVLILCAILILTVVTTLERFWFFAGMSLFILFIVSLRLDVLQLFGQTNSTSPIATLLLYVGIAYYFNSIKPETGFSQRFLFFLLVTGALSVLIFFFAEIQFPMLHLAVTGYSAGLILTILFFFMVAHEILASFVYITSQGAAKPLRDFLIISVIYMINVFITCLHEMGTIQWNFIYINLYLLITISGVLGLWGFKLRENLYENILSFSPFGALFYLAFGTICFITISQLLGNANDAALKVVRDLIIFTHTAFGIIFLMYIFSNFMAMMADRFHVYRVLYKPNRMPYFTFKFAGVIVTLAFVFVSHWRDYVNHSVAGFFTYAADLYAMQDNEPFAKALYERSTMNSFQNHRANYALGMIKASRVDFVNADKNFEQANRKTPSDFSLVNQGNLHLYLKEYFPAIHTFRNAESMKHSAALDNNLGFAYAKIHNLDSAIYFISEARKNKLTRPSAEGNFFALITSEYIPVKTDSILTSFDSDAPAVVGNALAAATLFNQEFKKDINPLSVNQLDLYTATLLNNYIIRNAEAIDSAFANRAYRVANDSVNWTFGESIKAALSHVFYHKGNVFKAQQILAELTFLNQGNRGKYNYIQGLWALEQGNPSIAKSYFAHAGNASYKKARLYYAIAATEMGNRQEALVAWDSVQQHGDDAEKQIASKIIRVLNMTPAEAMASSDAEKYQFTRYVLSLSDTTFFSRLSNAFDNSNYKAQALLDMSKKQFASGNTKAAIRFYNQISGLQLSDKKLYEEIRHFELRMLASRKEVRNLATQINKGITFEGKHALDKMWYTAIISAASGDVKTAEKNYEVLGLWNPYFEDGIIAAADFFREQDQKSPKPYTILSEAIQINNTSIRLMEAYVAEAIRQGFDEYAQSAMQRLNELKKLQ